MNTKREAHAFKIFRNAACESHYFRVRKLFETGFSFDEILEFYLEFDILEKNVENTRKKVKEMFVEAKVNFYDDLMRNGEMDNFISSKD